MGNGEWEWVRQKIACCGLVTPLFVPVDRYREQWSGSVLILAPGELPTTDFYLTPRIGKLDPKSVFRFDSRRLDTDPEKLPVGTFVVIVRHASPAWLHALERCHNRWSGVAYLMDDDIPMAWRCGDVPLDYGLWTTGRYLRIKHLLPRVCDRVWVSTPALRERYPGTRVVPPLPYVAARGPAPKGTRRWGYHGTRIHQRELRWLVPVIKAVQQAVPTAEFEVFGGPRVVRLFSGIPRVRMLPTLSWLDYAAYCDNSSLAVGVAPLLPGKFNAVRSHTRAFDIASCGAAGIFSSREPYASALAGTGAALLPDEPDVWAAGIVRLLTDDELREEQYHRTVQWMHEICRGEDIAALINDKVMER